MIQDQLIGYITSQTRLGVSRDALRTSLIAAGWAAADVDDSLKKAEEGKPLSSAPVSSVAASPAMGAVGIASKPADPQAIPMSDLISVPKDASTFSAGPDQRSPKKPDSMESMRKQKPAAMKAPDVATEFPSRTPGMPAKGKGGLITEIILGVLALGFAAAAGFFYFQNSSLTGQIANMTGQSAAVSAKLAGLQSTVDAANMNMVFLQKMLDDVKNNLSFYTTVPSIPAGVSREISIAGVVSGGGKVPYVLTTRYGAKLSVQNSKDVQVINFLAPLLGTSTVVSGTYFSGTPNITIILPPVAPASPLTTKTATSTATSSPAK